MRKYVRWVIGVFVIGFAIFVARQLKERTPPAAPPAIPRTDPGAVVESTKGNVLRFNSSKESFTVYYDRQLTYEEAR